MLIHRGMTEVVYMIKSVAPSAGQASIRQETKLMQKERLCSSSDYCFVFILLCFVFMLLV